jgi:tetratricopeptide (TPR) repeat protein
MFRSNSSVSSEINRAVALQRAGKIVAAASIYKSVLQKVPNSPEANHLLGVCYLQTNDLERAEALIGKAVSLAPRSADFQSNYGLVLARLGRTSDAVKHFERALKIDGKHHDALVNFGHLLQQLGDRKRALEFYLRAVAVQNSARALSNSGALMSQLGMHREALVNLQRAVDVDPADKSARINFGNTLRMVRRFDDALVQYDRALLIDSGSTDALNGRACTLVDLDRTDEAIEDFQSALELDPDNPLFHRNLGNCYVKKKDFDRALAHLNRALRSNSSDDQAFFSRGAILLEKGRQAEAISDFDRVLEINPNHVRARWNKAVACLQLGDFATGWDLYETRWAALPEQLAPLRTIKPRWSQQTGAARLLIWSEQGAGDEVFFSRGLSHAASLSRSVLVQVDGRFIPLFERSFPDLRFVARRRKVAEAEYDAHIPMGSILSQVYGAGGEFLAERLRVPYLKPRSIPLSVASRIAEIRREGSCIVGLTWQSKNLVHGASKSFSLDDLEPLFNKKELKFISLQYGDVDRELEDFRARSGIHIEQFKEIDNFHDIDLHVALANACDFVVSGCNTTAHLVGAIGKRAFVGVTHGQAAFWYWHNVVGNRSLWYPSISLVYHKESAAWRDTVSSLGDLVADYLLGNDNAAKA